MHKGFTRLIQSRLALFTLGYLALFLGISLVQQNTEFFFYTIVLLGVLFIIIFVVPSVRLESWILSFASLFILLHLLSGSVTVDSVKLYDVFLVGDFFRMDNFVHLLGGVLSTFLAYNLLAPFVHHKVRNNPLTFSFIVILIALGIGSVNELLELTGVVFFDAGEAVGGYMNNAVDQLYNLVGAVLASIVIYVDRRFDADGKYLISIEPLSKRVWKKRS